jgi:hypothetical protein
MSSDNITLLQHTTNITAGFTITTEKVILGQYISFNCLASASEDLTVVFQFSGDGSNWDYSVTNQYPSGSNTIHSSPVVAKWLRLKITNIGIVDTTHCRVFVYGTPSNSSVLVQLQKIGNITPEVDVENLPFSTFGDLAISELTPIHQYVFERGTTGLMTTGAWKMPNPNFYSYATPGCTSTLDFTNGVVSTGTNLTLGEKLLLQGGSSRYKAGVGLVSRFTGAFVQGVKSSPPNNGACTQYLGIGNSDISTGVVSNFVGFGYADPSLAASDSNSFGIIHINNSVRTFIPRTSWNVDRGDGTAILPSLDWSKLQVFQIQLQYLGGGNINFFIENVNTSKYELVHRLKLAGTLTGSSLSNPSLGMLMFQEYEAGSIPVTLTDKISSASFLLARETSTFADVNRVCSVSSKSAVSAETLLISLRNDDTWYSAPNFSVFEIDLFSFSSDGTKPVIFNVYQNCTIGGVPVYSKPYPDLIGVSTDTAGTFTAIGSGSLIFSFTLAKDDSKIINVATQHLKIYTNDVISITAQSAANSNVSCTASYHN